MAWLGEHRAFVVEEFIKNGGSVTSTQRAFWIRFELCRRDSVPDAKTIRLWVSNFRQTGSAPERKPTGRPRTAITPENVARVRTSIQQSPKRSAVKHAAALGLSERSLSSFLLMKPTSTCVELLTNRISATGLQKILWNSTKNHYTVQKSQFGAPLRNLVCGDRTFLKKDKQ
ncbi:uncharacterized protein LOC120355018 [Nilaparvata lugens]|uniref:uncharacterized protein LOC120355018 n=1 Tax=Nilaparvata lugens TaxID=108931 RepID=UPI00193E08D8|nr:uncharacterized protein LOC120355018 [Nilaparvata lugens]